MTDLVYYHSKCLDGLMASAVHATVHNATVPTLYREAVYGNTDYSDVADPKVTRIVFLDFCPPFDVHPWNDIANLEKEVIIIDHHIHAINKAKEHFKGVHPDNLTAILDTTFCGAALAYFYYKAGLGQCTKNLTSTCNDHQYMVNIDLNAWNRATETLRLPTSLYLTNDYDLWEHKLEASTHFAAGMQLNTTSAAVDPKKLASLIDDVNQVDEYIDSGHTLHAKQLCDVKLYEQRTMVANRIALVNAPDDLSSILGEHLNTSLDIDFSISYMYYPKDRCYKISLRSKDHAIDNIATALGGGGHRDAAGVRIELDNLTAIQRELVHWITGRHNGDRFYRCLYDLNLAPIQYLR